MGFWENFRNALGLSDGLSDDQREAKRIQEQIQRENAVQSENLNYVSRCIAVFRSDASVGVRLAHLGKAVGTLNFMLETYPHRDDWREWLQHCNDAHSAFMTTQLEGEFETLLARADIAKSRSSKISNANKGLLLIQQAEENPENTFTPSVLAVWREKFTAYIHQTELDDLLMKADKYEFKGEWKKAVSAYQDVLFFLKRDHIPDEEQAEQLAEIEARVADMQRYIAESKKK